MSSLREERMYLGVRIFYDPADKKYKFTYRDVTESQVYLTLGGAMNAIGCGFVQGDNHD